MAISKVVLHDDSGADRTLVDLTGDTVAPETLMEGATAHDKAGNPIVGTVKPGEGSPQVQSDWAENDPQSPAYVKNRFGGYEDATEEVIFPEQFLAFVDGFNETLMPKFSAGDTIKVVWGGEIYTCEAREIIPVEAPWPYVGNLAIVSYGADTGEPFIIGELEGGGLFYALSRVDGTFSLSLSKVSKTAIKIDPKYLPAPPDPLPPITPDDESAFLQVTDGRAGWKNTDFLVTFTQNYPDVTCDRTYAEIVSAYTNGKSVRARFVRDSYTTEFPVFCGLAYTQIEFAWLNSVNEVNPNLCGITIDRDSVSTFTQRKIITTGS